MEEKPSTLDFVSDGRIAGGHRDGQLAAAAARFGLLVRGHRQQLPTLAHRQQLPAQTARPLAVALVPLGLVAPHIVQQTESGFEAEEGVLGVAMLEKAVDNAAVLEQLTHIAMRLAGSAVNQVGHQTRQPHQPDRVEEDGRRRTTAAAAANLVANGAKGAELQRPHDRQLIDLPLDSSNLGQQQVATMMLRRLARRRG